MRKFCCSRSAVVWLAAAGLASASVACMAQDTNRSNLWNGSWKTEASSFHYEGASFSIATDAKGYTVTSGGVAQPAVVCDGKPHSNAGGNDVTCVKTATGYTVTASKGGKPVSKSRVSATATTITRRFDFTSAGEDPYSVTTVAKRVSGGPGVAGVWKPVNFTESKDTGVLGIEVTGDSVAFKETDSPTPVACKLDGTPTKFPLGGTMAVKMIDPHTLKVYYYGDDGTERRENTFVLSLDGKTISETDFTPAPGAAAMILLLHKM